MTVKISYPHVERRTQLRQITLPYAKWILFSVGALCLLLNLIIGGPWWSAIVLWACITCWSFLIWPDLVALNRISLWIRIVLNAALLLTVIAFLFSRSASRGIPLVWFIGETVSAALFLTDIQRQKQNMAPMLLLLAIGLVTSVAGLIFDAVAWEYIATGVAAIIILFVCVALLGNDFLQAIKKAIHTR